MPTLEEQIEEIQSDLRASIEETRKGRDVVMSIGVIVFITFCISAFVFACGLGFLAFYPSWMTFVRSIGAAAIAAVVSLPFVGWIESQTDKNPKTEAKPDSRNGSGRPTILAVNSEEP